jgi:hypothetical protein
MNQHISIDVALAGDDVICGECCRGNLVVVSGSLAVCHLCKHEVGFVDMDPDPGVRIVWRTGELVRAVEVEA